MNKFLKLKIFLILVLGIVTLLSIWYFVNRFIYRSRATGGPPVTITFSPLSGSFTVGETKNLDIVIQPSDLANKIGGVDLTFAAEGVAKIVNVSVDLLDEVKNDASINGKTPRIVYVSEGSKDLPQSVKITLSFQGTGEGDGTITIKSDSPHPPQIIGNVSGYEYSLPSSLPSATYSFTPSASGGTTSPCTGGETMKLNFSLKLQGVPQKPVLPSGEDSIAVKVTVVGGGLTSPLIKTVPFTADDEGIWTGSLCTNDVSSADGYKILVKGPKHLQKKICDGSPSETYPGTYICGERTFSLEEGDNALDFSNIILPAGDLPAQDGIINTYDLSLIKESIGNSDTGALNADVNFDGYVNTQDYSLVISSLAIKADEE